MNFINPPLPHTGIAVPNCHFSADFLLSERIEPETSVSVYIVQLTGLRPLKLPVEIKLFTELLCLFQDDARFVTEQY